MEGIGPFCARPDDRRRTRRVCCVSGGGYRDRMEGGIGFFLLLIVLVVVVGGGIALYVTGGALWSRDGDDGADAGHRPLHKTPRDPAQEHTHFVGTPEGDEAHAARAEPARVADD